jgi:hypothetical protein
MAVEEIVVLGRRAKPLVLPLVRRALDPPLLPLSLRPRRWVDSLGRRGSEERASLLREAGRVLDALVPVVVHGLVRRADLTTVVTRYLDLDDVVARVDLDAAASRLDVNGVARRLDVDAVLDRLDLTGLVLDRVDLEVVVRAVLDRIDLTRVVLERVDLDTLVDAVLERVDLVALAEEVIDAVDLPEIIRESTGSMASDSIRGARMQGIAADEAVNRVRNRLLFRHGHGHGQGAPETAPPVPAPPGGPGLP